MMNAQEAMDQAEAWDYSAEVKTILSKLGINDTAQSVKHYQADSKACCFGKTLIEQPDLLLLDEPTNHLDFDSINGLLIM